MAVGIRAYSDDQLAKIVDEAKAEQKRRKEAKKWPVTTRVYIHGDEDSNWEVGKEIGLSEQAILDTFRGVAYEVELTIVVQQDGHAHATHINDVEITIPVQVT